jgi:plastocyanin
VGKHNFQLEILRPELRGGIWIVVAALIVTLAAGGRSPADAAASFLPNAEDSKIVSVSKSGEPEAAVTVMTVAVAVKETGPQATVKKFGETYAFSPNFIAVHRDEPTQIEFWNLQPDDEHDFALLGPDLKVMMYERLKPLSKSSWIFTFHREGLFDFKCLTHQPEMAGQILVLPPQGK